MNLSVGESRGAEAGLFILEEGRRRSAPAIWRAMLSWGDCRDWRSLLKADIQVVLSRESATTQPVSSHLADSDVEERGMAEAVQASSSKGKQVAKKQTQNEVVPRIRYIIVKDASSKRYKAVLIWLQTDKISFKSLTSARGGTKAASPDAVSPKSIYALAHKLELVKLQRLALHHFAKQLTARNALQKLFSGHAAIYSELSQEAMIAAVKFMSKIKASRGHAYIEEVPSAGKSRSGLRGGKGHERFGGQNVGTGQHRQKNAEEQRQTKASRLYERE